MSENIKDIYPLSPMQQGMLFHSIYSSGDELYTEQMACKFVGALDTDAFQKAWQQVVARHDILRTAFVYEDLEEPLQVVYEIIELPFRILDWQHLSKPEAEQQFNILLEEERKEGLELTSAPLMRIVLAKLNANETYFIWNHHHLLFDGWGLPLILQEVFKFYESALSGQTVNLPYIRPYKDYIAWLQEQDMDSAESFWKEQLQGFSAPTPLTVKSKTGQTGYGREKYSLSEETTSKLNQLVKDNQITLNTLLQGTWALLLAKYSNETDVLFGSTVSGRPAELPGVETMLGLFINTLPVRVQIDAQENVLEWLKALQLQTAETRQFEYTPLVNIHGWSNIPGSMPLFESLLIFENYPSTDELAQDEQSLKIEDVRSFERTNYPLTLVAGPAKALFLEIAYECDSFSQETVRRILKHLETILTQIANNANLKLNEINVISEDEKQLVLETWNCKYSDFGDGKTIHQIFESYVLQDANAPAIEYKDKQLTYLELNEAANQLANYLIKQGVSAETLVGLSFERSIETVIAVLAVLKAGGAYLPIDPEYPQERIDFMIADSSIKLLLTQSSITEQFQKYDLNIISIDTESDAISKMDKSNPEVAVSANNLAYVIYTSGSTGKPKGVLVQHRGAANLAHNMKKDYLLEKGKSVLQLASFSFDGATGEIFAALLNGAKVQMVERDTLLSTEKLVEFLNTNQVTTATLPPSLLSILPQDEINSFETIISIGDVCSAELANRWHDKVRFFNGYGPTENTVGAIWQLISQPITNAASAPIGKPIENVQVYLLDSDLNPVPVGVPGEIHLGGPGLARGYLNRPELTAEKFIPNPFNQASGERLYKTGDLARFLENGQIEFVGRVDFQVKLRGFRIELGEIEAELLKNENIQDAVVSVHGETSADKSISAYIIAKENTSLQAEDVRTALKGTLPDYMLPSAIFFMDHFPLSPNGKVNRKALPAPDAADRLDGDYVAPRTPEEELLAALWADVLDLDKVGVESNFFELGGHSLLATQLISRIRDAFDVDIELRNLFEQPTIAYLAAEIERITKGEAGIAAPPIEKADRSQPLPLSYSQQRLWFLDQLEPNSPVYNIPSALKLNGPLNVPALEKSINEIIRRHESLRTTFAGKSGKPYQIVNETTSFILEQIDLSPLPADQRASELKRLIEKDALLPFNLSSGSLFRATLVKLEKESNAIIFNMHHIISDGWSVGVLMHEITQLYTAFCEDNPSPLPELEIQYPDFATWQQNYLKDEVLANQINYWNEKLAGAAPILELPTDRPRPAVQTFNGASETVEFSEELTQSLRDLCKEEGATLFMTLLTAFKILLHRYSRQDDILVGSPIANRTKSKIERLIGFFVNTLVMRSDLSDNPEFAELLADVRETALGAYAHQDMPFEKLVEELQPQRDLSHSPLFQVAFVLQNLPADNSVSASELTMEPLSGNVETAKYNLTLTMVERADQLAGTMEYNTDLFDAETIQRMLAHFEKILQSISDDPEITIEDIPLLDDSEEQKILADWNISDTPFPLDRCVHQVFESLVNEQPTATALAFQKDAASEALELNYQELNEQANQLAHFLLSRGIQKEDVVGISLERSLEMVVAMLAIQKAGAAYVPIDPAYPQDRISYMIQDSGLRFVLSTENLRDRFTDTPDILLTIDSNAETIKSQPTENPNINLTPDNLAYIIYTSGSTGKPKGTLLHHKGAVNLAFLQQKTFNVKPGSRILQFASLSFDAATWEFLMAMLSGSALILTSAETITAANELLKVLEKQKVTTVTLPPSVLAVWPQNELPDLQTIITAGEAVSPELVQTWSKGRDFFNAYGPTETTVCASIYKCSGTEKTAPPIGKSNPNFKLYILDTQFNPVPIGVPGELCVSGAGIARGYHQRPDLTADKFIPNRFSTEAGDRLYRTGDLVRYLADGNVEFLGRIDQQVKIRGFRIELGEIEAVISKHPEIVDQTVIAREDSPGDKRLVAYLVKKESSELDSQQLKTFVRSSLPEYMTPSAIVFMEALPLTANGKINKNALTAPELSRDELSAAYVAPRNETEEKLTKITAELLNLEQVGVQDNFFELGGHSLLATQFMSRIQETFNLELPLRTLFEKPTIEDIAKEILNSGTKPEEKSEQAPQIQRVARSSRRIKRSDIK